MPHEGIHSVTVRGQSDGWSKAHQRFGAFHGKISSPRDFYAEYGYAVPEMVHGYWEERKTGLS